MGIRFNQVSHFYEKPKKGILSVAAINDINLSFADQGEFVMIVGHTGSGKSTLLQHINGLLLPTNGCVCIDDLVLTKKKRTNPKLKPIRKNIGFVFQFPEYQLFEETVIRDIIYGPKNFGMSNEEAYKSAKEVARKLNITNILEKSPFNISGGQMRKVAIAAAVLVALFVGSNGIAYAMTGETWVEKIIIRRITDGIEYEIEAEVRHLKNGETVYYGEYTTPDGKVHAPVDYDGEGPYIYFWFEDEGAEIWSHNGKTYIWDGDMELDISEDFADDGLALGTYVVNGVFKKYGLKRHEDGTISASLYSPPKYTWPDYWR